MAKKKIMNGYTIAAIVFTVLAALFGGIGTWKSRHAIKDEIIGKGDENTNKILSNIFGEKQKNSYDISPPELAKPDDNTKISIPIKKRNDFELRRYAIPIFDETFKIIQNYIGELHKTAEFEDFIRSNNGYGIKENPLRKEWRYGFTNKFYKDIKSMPLTEIIVDDYQYVFKLDDEEYFKVSVFNEINYQDLTEKIEKVYLNKFRADLSDQ